MEILAAQEAAPEAGQRAEAGPTAEATGGAPLALVRVIDGDTFAYGGVKVRIADIDTPELQGRCPHESRLAEQAAVRLQGLLAEGPFDLERVERDEDRFGRKLRLVTRGGESLGATLVAEGLARPWDGARRSWCG
jgi:endonuclease YncB( thermonuclease family)